MKKLLSILLIAVLLLSIAGCTATEEKEIVLPPTRYGIYGGIVDYATFDAAEFFADADAVARVKVGNWLWEDCESQGNDYTYYQAQVLESYKGTVPENFTLVQNGSSQDTIYGPLLTYGNEMLLFLNKAAPGVSPFKNAYHCSAIPSLHVSYANDGKRYFVTPHTKVGESIIRTTPVKELPVAEVIENAIKDDPFRSNILSQGSHVFSEEDIELFFASLEQEQPVIHSKKETGILPPTRFGNQWAFEEFAVEYTFESLYAQADAVARLIVGDWLREDTELSVTDYEASVVDTFKGDLPKTITLKQNGCSKDSKGHPLFTYGNEVLLFLKAEEDTPNTYGILESYTSVIDISYDDQGLAYYVVRHDDFGATVPGRTLDDYQESYDIYNNLLEQDLMIGREREALSRTFERNKPYMFSVSDLNAWFATQKNG